MVRFFKFIENILSRFKIILRHFPFLANLYLYARDSCILTFTKPQTSVYGFKFMSYSPILDYTHADTDLILDEAKNNDIFIDVGANVGFYTCLTRNLAKRVIAIEPMKQNLNFLYKNLKINGWKDVEVLPIGLGANRGKADIYGACTGASLIKQWSGVSENWKHTIEIDTLDNILVNRFNDKRILIKVDVEGAEYNLLLGAKSILALSVRPVWIVEICFKEHSPNGFNANFRKTFEIFWQMGYSSFTLDAGVVPVKPCDIDRWIKNGSRDVGGVTYLFK